MKINARIVTTVDGTMYAEAGTDWTFYSISQYRCFRVETPWFSVGIDTYGDGWGYWR